MSTEALIAKLEFIDKYNKPSFAFRNLKASEGVGGAGEIRTPVQTCNYNAFYMFSFYLDFRQIAG